MIGRRRITAVDEEIKGDEGRAVYIAMVNEEWKLVLNVKYNCRTMFSYGNQRLENVDTDTVNGWQDLVGVCGNDLFVFIF